MPRPVRYLATWPCHPKFSLLTFSYLLLPGYILAALNKSHFSWYPRYNFHAHRRGLTDSLWYRASSADCPRPYTCPDPILQYPTKQSWQKSYYLAHTSTVSWYHRIGVQRQWRVCISCSRWQCLSCYCSMPGNVAEVLPDEPPIVKHLCWYQSYLGSGLHSRFPWYFLAELMHKFIFPKFA